MVQPAGYRSAGGYNYNDGPSPYKPLMFIALAVMGLVVPWYFTYEPVIEEIEQQWNLLLLLLPLLLLLALIFLASSSAGGSPNSVLNSFIPASDPSAIHRVGGSPVGLAALLLLILTMVWYHSDILDSWNPLVRS